jgi:hypothetical protein
MPLGGSPQSISGSGIPQLPPPEVHSPVTTGPPAASPKSKVNVLWVAVLVVVLAMAFVLLAWRGRSRTSAAIAPYVGLLALVRGLGVSGQPHVRSQSLRLEGETLDRLSQLRRPDESVAEVVARAVAALEAAPDPTAAEAVTTQRLDTLEARLQRLEGGTRHHSLE